MLYVHCGWPRTGTTSLQAALAARCDQLAEAGVDYPDRWRPRGSDAHYGIAELLGTGVGEGHAGIAELLDYLRSNADRRTLISCEALSNWLSAERCRSLADLLLRVRDAVPVTCLWTLRRLDRWATSMYLHLIETGRDVPSPEDYFLGWGSDVTDVFAGLSEVSGALGDGSVFFRYADSGAHCGEILRTVGIPGPIRAEIEADLQRGRRRNLGLTQKEAVALLHADAVSARAGVELSSDRLRSALRRGGFAFAGDATPELVEPEVAATLHTKALQAAREAGLDAYVEFFGSEQVEPRPPASLEPDVLTEGDLSRLVAHQERSP